MREMEIISSLNSPYIIQTIGVCINYEFSGYQQQAFVRICSQWLITGNSPQLGTLSKRKLDRYEKVDLYLRNCIWNIYTPKHYPQ